MAHKTIALTAELRELVIVKARRIYKKVDFLGISLSENSAGRAFVVVLCCHVLRFVFPMGFACARRSGDGTSLWMFQIVSLDRAAIFVK